MCNINSVKTVVAKYKYEIEPYPPIKNISILGKPNVTPIKLKLDSINLDNLKDALRRSEDISDPEEDAITIPATPSWPSITMYVLVFFTGVGVAVYKLWWQRRSAQITADPEAVQLRSHPSLRLHLKGGGIMSQ
ncbi:hypothetical protein SFRURICE_019532 [Spodoptera frugiperda]|uniref:SFRICE_030753 n=1 Tax=Spodoptera frugiperda TaxID=7108 RepID=A0A2H1WU46_SPOFR|nr:hypothetical protein SFRURICE_019532 [Spodoptera frugiperda]